MLLALLPAIRGRAGLRVRLVALEQQLERIPCLEAELSDERGRARAEAAGLQEIIASHRATIAELEVLVAQQRCQADEKIALLTQAGENLKQEFQNLAQGIFEEKTRRFSEQSRASIEGLMAPLRDQIGDFRKRVDDVYDREARDRVALFQEITHLKDLNTTIGREAVNLTRALKGDSKARGNWGEMILERLLEQAGLQEGREFDLQCCLPGVDGKRYQPDVIVRLPGGRDVIIDAKVSLNAFERYSSAEDDEARERALREHIASLRNHIRELGAKHYEDLPGIRSLDFVLLFVPIEAALQAAISAAGDLPSEAFERNIFIVSPATLLVCLSIINNLWHRENQSTNAREIAKKAGDLYDHFVRFVASLEEVGHQITKASAAYEQAHRRLVSGRGSLVSRSEALRKLGVKAKRELPICDLQAGEGE